MSDERRPSVRALVRELVGTAPAPPPLRLDADRSSTAWRPRVAVASIAVVAIALVVVGLVAVPPGPSRSGVGPTSTTSSAAFADLQVPVAIAGGDDVRIVSAHGVVRVRGPETCCVQWSGDRRWIAFLSGDTATSPRATGDLVVARADGTQRHVVAQDVGSFGWSARDDMLAYGTTTEVVITAVDGRLRGQSEVVAHGAPSDVAWLQHPLTRADELAMAVSDPKRDVGTLRVATVVGQCSTLAGCVHVGTPLDVGAHDPHFALRIASWRPDGRALAVWMETLENNGRLDGLPLLLVSLSARPPVALGSGVVQPDWVHWSPDGQQLVFVEGVGREIWDTPRRLRVCNGDGTACRTITSQAIQARDPSWSADGSTIFFTSISAATNDAYLHAQHGSGVDWRPLFAKRQLWSIRPDGSGARRVPATPLGVGAPQPAGADQLVLVHDRLVEQLDLGTGRVLVVGRLVEPPNVDPYAHEPLYMPDDAVYEGIESGPGGWSRWFAVAPTP